MYENNNNAAGGLIIVIVVLGFIVFAVMKCGADVGGQTHDTAQKEAEKWVRQMGLNAKAQCADRDTDNDGYVSCTLVVTDPDGKKHVEPLECAGSFTTNNGCRAPKALVRTNQ